MTKKLYAALVTAAAAGALLAAPGASAQAVADGYDRCPADHYCLFSGLDGTGEMVALQDDTPNLAAVGMDNRAKSDWNRTGYRINLWSDADYTGCMAVTGVGGKGNFFSSFRDFFSSVEIDAPNGMSC
ncbi:peptidase inhibitor family I36 protein [Streptomyces sp. WMMC500]|uniref:peptidase inhibitor family I36 protein n=1 Tax=Streptomyces sp. WMMC500 TaxID=3015154 RepID=UPI00248AE5D2|nr:peptidase inhibitor family I36 protein [Streptomyces sp. WMMC500]WBB64120.1 peptidase inhibitor family I36 protein [Streptomyces sp. WMMC500]